MVDVFTSDADRVKISRSVDALSCAFTEHLMRTVSGGLSQQEKAPAELGLIELSFCLNRRLSGETSESQACLSINDCVSSFYIIFKLCRKLTRSFLNKNI